VATQSAKTAAQVARAIANALERRKIPYAIGGAIALGFYAPPRAALDRRKVRDRLVKLVSEKDERVRAWDDLAREQ